jgi:hypothetical protein
LVGFDRNPEKLLGAIAYLQTLFVFLTEHHSVDTIFQVLVVFIIILAYSGYALIPIGLVGMFLKAFELNGYRRFRKKAKKTTGQVVGKLPARYSSKTYYSPNGLPQQTPTVDAGYLLLVEYTVGDSTWRAKTEKVYDDEVETLSVLYDPDDPGDAVLDGYFRDKMMAMKVWAAMVGIPGLSALVIWALDSLAKAT